MKIIFITIEEFLANGGILEIGMPIYKKELRQFDQKIYEKNNILENTLLIGEYIGQNENGVYLVKNQSFKSIPLSPIVGHVKIQATPIYNIHRQIIIESEMTKALKAFVNVFDRDKEYGEETIGRRIINQAKDAIIKASVYEKLVRPKQDDEKRYLSKQKEYKVLNVLFNCFQIENDRGVIDYYEPNLFKNY